MIIPSGCMTYLCKKILRSICLSLLFLVCIFATSAQVFAEEGTESRGNNNGGTETVATQPLSTAPAPTPINPEPNRGPVNTRSYQPLVGIPGVDNAVANFGTYINQLYFLAISLAALLAVIKIIIAGVKYMLTDLGSSKADAKSDIWGALLGLLLIISAFLILTTINPNLANLDALSKAPPLQPTRMAPSNNTISGSTVVAGEGRVSNESAVNMTTEQRQEFQRTQCQGGTVVTNTVTGQLRCQQPISTETRTTIEAGLPNNVSNETREVVTRLLEGRNPIIPSAAILPSQIVNGAVQVTSGQTTLPTSITADRVYFSVQLTNSMTNAGIRAESENICRQIGNGSTKVGIEISNGVLSCVGLN